jgi:hypothetical protein
MLLRFRSGVVGGTLLTIDLQTFSLATYNVFLSVHSLFISEFRGKSKSPVTYYGTERKFRCRYPPMSHRRKRAIGTETVHDRVSCDQLSVSYACKSQFV